MESSPRWSSGLSVLRQRDFALFLSGRVTSLLGSSMAPIAISFAILDRHGTASEVGVVLAAQSIPLVALLLAGGGAADRWGRRRAMVVADVSRAGAQGALAAWIIVGNPPLVVFVAAVAVVGAGHALFGPASTGLVPQLVTDPEQLQQANSLRGLATSLASVAGPAVAGVIVAVINPGWAVASGAAAYLLSAVLLVQLHVPDTQAASARQSFVGQLRDGWTEFRSRTWLWIIVVQYAFFHLLIFAPFMVLGVVVAKESLGGAAAWGAILAALSAGSVLGSLLMVRFRPRRPLLLATSTGVLWGIPLLTLGLAGPAWSVGLGAFAAGCGLGIFSPLWDTTLQREVPGRVLSSVSSYDYLGSVGLIPLGYALAGPVSAITGTAPLFIGGAVWVAASTLAVLAVPSVRNLSSPRIAPPQ